MWPELCTNLHGSAAKSRLDNAEKLSCYGNLILLVDQSSCRPMQLLWHVLSFWWPKWHQKHKCRSQSIKYQIYNDFFWLPSKDLVSLCSQHASQSACWSTFPNKCSCQLWGCIGTAAVLRNLSPGQSEWTSLYCLGSISVAFEFPSFSASEIFDVSAAIFSCMVNFSASIISAWNIELPHSS